MAKTHRKTAVSKTARPQWKARTVQTLQPDTPAQLVRRGQFSFSELEGGLNTIHAISDVLDYTQDLCQDGPALSMTIIAAGMAEALKVVHRRMAGGIAAE
jgi:hypothetical protein